MYNHKAVVFNTNKGKKIIRNIFCSLIKKPNKYINNYYLKKHGKERAISDFIAGMTDRYAINLNNLIKWIYFLITKKKLIIYKFY